MVETEISYKHNEKKIEMKRTHNDLVINPSCQIRSGGLCEEDRGVIPA